MPTQIAVRAEHKRLKQEVTLHLSPEWLYVLIDFIRKHSASYSGNIVKADTIGLDCLVMMQANAFTLFKPNNMKVIRWVYQLELILQSENIDQVINQGYRLVSCKAFDEKDFQAAEEYFTDLKQQSFARHEADAT